MQPIAPEHPTSQHKPKPRKVLATVYAVAIAVMVIACGAGDTDTSSSEVGDTGMSGSAIFACSHSRNIAIGLGEGTLNETEAREKFKEVLADAKTSFEPSLEEAALGVVASFTRNEPESMKVTAIEQLLAVCNSLAE